MKIIKLRLEKYKRLLLRSISVFEITPQALFQMIIGTNGSGKSSIVEELSPMPADKNRYENGGSKTIWIRHQGKDYELRSEKSAEGDMEHSFQVDGVELNRGRTVTVQRGLVLEHFKVTKETHDLAMGKSRFSQMDTGDRRKWFTALSEANYDYALGVFGKMKKRERDAVGALNRLNQRLVGETSKILPDEAYQQLKATVVRYQDILEFLLERRIPIEQSSETLLSQIYDHSAVLIETAKALSKQVKQIDPSLPPEFNMLNEMVIERRSIIQACKTLGDQYFHEHEQVQATYEALERTHTQSIAAIDVEITNLERLQATTLAGKVLPIPTAKDPQSALMALNSSSDWITSVLETLPKNADKRYSRASLEHLTDALSLDEGLIETNERRAKAAQSKLDHYESLKNQGTTECPNCQHVWIKFYDAVDVAHQTEVLASHTEYLERLRKHKDEAEKEIQAIRDYFQSYTRYTTHTAQWPVLQGLWDHIQDSGNLLNNPTMVMAVLENYKADLAIEVKVLQIAQQIQEKQNLLAATQQNAGLDFETVKRNKEDLEAKILTNQRRSGTATTELNQLTRHIAEIEAVIAQQERLQQLMELNEQIGDKAQEALRREHYQELVRTFQTMLARADTALKQADDQAKIIRDIEQQIEFCRHEHRCLQVLVQELSPTEGLIAEGLFGFMKLFIKQVNALIAKVWTYPLVVYPCELDSDQKVDLDYSFPMRVNDQPELRKDIKEGSDGMLEVVDLGFRLTAMKALGLGTYPIFLDEFGKAMDPLHKLATVTLVNNIMEQDSFSQLFMISHDTAQYGAIANSELCVLCDANVIIPKNCVYNRHVLIL